MQKPSSESRHLYTGGRLGSRQVSPKLILGLTAEPVLTSSMEFRRLIEWFACARLSESYLPRSFAVTFPKRSLPWLFTNAALGGLKPAPASRLRGAKPSSSVQPRGALPPTYKRFSKPENFCDTLF